MRIPSQLVAINVSASAKDFARIENIIITYPGKQENKSDDH